jgi:hypothetical protein
MNEAKVYIVRIWSSAARPAGFRAAVRAVDKDEARLFADASLLGGYFEAELALGLDVTETAPAPASAEPKPSPGAKG